MPLFGTSRSQSKIRQESQLIKFLINTFIDSFDSILTKFSSFEIFSRESPHKQFIDNMLILKIKSKESLLLTELSAKDAKGYLRIWLNYYGELGQIITTEITSYYILKKSIFSNIQHQYISAIENGVDERKIELWLLEFGKFIWHFNYKNVSNYLYSAPSNERKSYKLFLEEANKDFSIFNMFHGKCTDIMLDIKSANLENFDAQLKDNINKMYEAFSKIINKYKSINEDYKILKSLRKNISFQELLNQNTIGIRSFPSPSIPHVSELAGRGGRHGDLTEYERSEIRRRFLK